METKIPHPSFSKGKTTLKYFILCVVDVLWLCGEAAANCEWWCVKWEVPVQCTARIALWDPCPTALFDMCFCLCYFIPRYARLPFQTFSQILTYMPAFYLLSRFMQILHPKHCFEKLSMLYVSLKKLKNEKEPQTSFPPSRAPLLTTCSPWLKVNQFPIYICSFSFQLSINYWIFRGYL